MAILKLSPALKLLASFKVLRARIVGDGDFGGSPSLFSATINGKSVPMVGACSKNGIYYALRRSNLSTVWQRKTSVKSSDKVLGQCQAAAAFDGHRLFMGGPGTTIGGRAFRGSVERLSPATGAIGWRTGLPNGVLTSPTINGNGVIGVGTYDNTKRPNERTWLMPRPARSCGHWIRVSTSRRVSCRWLAVHGKQHRPVRLGTMSVQGPFADINEPLMAL